KPEMKRTVLAGKTCAYASPPNAHATDHAARIAGIAGLTETCVLICSPLRNIGVAQATPPAPALCRRVACATITLPLSIIQLNPRVLRDLLPLVHLAHDERAEFLRRTAHGVHALHVQFLLDVAGLHRFSGFRVQ